MQQAMSLTNLRQVITACNDGAIAAQHAFHKIKGI